VPAWWVVMRTPYRVLKNERDGKRSVCWMFATLLTRCQSNSAYQSIQRLYDYNRTTPLRGIYLPGWGSGEMMCMNLLQPCMTKAG
jgi:hypothetical protein